MHNPAPKSVVLVKKYSYIKIRDFLFKNPPGKGEVIADGLYPLFAPTISCRGGTEFYEQHARALKARAAGFLHPSVG